ncbi:MAG: bacteriohemerythrin [Treponema sp.]|jgi:hemerythrin|nr:bacteriohemerythrin [Treponema sp.]
MLTGQAVRAISQDNGFVHWDSRYSVGIPLIDDQHKELIRLTNELYECCLLNDTAAKAAFMLTIKHTVTYVKYHFSAEEKLMQNIQFPGLAEHKKEHDAFVVQVLKEAKSFESGKQFVPNQFVHFLKDWTLSHIGVMDKKYAEYIRSLKKQGLLDKTVLSASPVNQ